MAEAAKFGFDFGTTNSSIAFFDGRELHRPVLDLNSDNPLVLPSLIYSDRHQQPTIGTVAARRYLQNETGRWAKWEKRRVGEIDGTQVFDRFYTVDELIALILRQLKASAERQLQTACTSVGLGRPVKFSPLPSPHNLPPHIDRDAITSSHLSD
jgi:hypothetical chaperone protein